TEASRNAIRDAGLTAKDIDGIVGFAVRPETVQGALGLPEVSFYLWTSLPPFHQQLIAGMNAVFSGLCDTVLVYHLAFRRAGMSRSAAGDPFRSGRGGGGAGMKPLNTWPDSIGGVPCYASWANRYMHDYDAKREYLGYVAINGRSNASLNEHAVQRTPIT